MIVGGYAVNHYGYLRNTFDVDIWINDDADNLERLYNALIKAGYKKENCKNAIDHFKSNHMFKIIYKDHIIDIMDSFIIKLSFINAYKRIEYIELGEAQIPVISYQDLLACKLKSNRYKDMVDIKELKEINKNN
jgi:hypothetical protein